MKASTRLILAALLTLPAAALTGCRSTAGTEADEERPLISEKAYSEASILAQTIEFLHDNYVESDQVSYEKLLTSALRGMVADLDPYSGYEPPKEFSANETRRTGELVGLGVEIVKQPNAPLLVVNVLPGSPAAAAGVKAPEKIMPSASGRAWRPRRISLNILPLLRSQAAARRRPAGRGRSCIWARRRRRAGVYPARSGGG